MSLVFRLFIITLFFAFASTAQENLTLSAEEQQLLQQIRCITCGGQTVLDSQSEFAGVIKRYVKSELRAGRTANEIKGDLRQIYGEDIILTPQFTYKTMLLWMAPLLFCAVFGSVFWVVLRLNRRA